MRPWTLGRPAAGVGISAEQKSRARLDTERQASPKEHNQQFLRSADRISDLRLPSDNQLCRD